jgi:hypothetical protein
MILRCYTLRMNFVSKTIHIWIPWLSLVLSKASWYIMSWLTQAVLHTSYLPRISSKCKSPKIRSRIHLFLFVASEDSRR